MELVLYDSDLKPVNLIEVYDELVWTDRYSECGDFELVISDVKNVVENYKLGSIIGCSLSDRLMIVEKIVIETSEEGARATISGRSLESVLSRRIVWKQKVLSGNMQNAIKTLINEAIINPSDSARRISNFTFTDSTDSEITSLTIDAKYNGDDLYSVISSICEEHELGFKIGATAGSMSFSLYRGEDHSFDQSINPYVIFSESFENLKSCNYAANQEKMPNCVLIGGVSETDASTEVSTQTYSQVLSEDTGLERIEIYCDASGVSKENNGETLSASDYEKILQDKGREALNEQNKESQVLDGEIEDDVTFKYGVDYTVGDIVQIDNDLIGQNKVRVVEHIISADSSGLTSYSSFEIVMEEE